MADHPTKEELTAYNECLAFALRSIDEAKTHVEYAHDSVEAARDAARTAFGTAGATSAFGNTLSDLALATRAIADARDGLPALDEGDGED